MKPCLLMLGLLSFITVPGYLTEMCLYNPPEVPYATFEVLAYKNGTMLNCECKKGFRRVNGLTYILCSGNSSWSNKCQCASNSNGNTRKQVTSHPKGQRERQNTETQSSTLPGNHGNLLAKRKQVSPRPEGHTERQTTATQSSTWPGNHRNIPGHCKEPPPWEHESTKRIYHVSVGQTVYYQCMQGYKALQKHPATSVCKTICGKTGWTQPQLTCVEEREHHQFQGKEESQGNSLSESETSCPFTITDTEQPPEAATTMETMGTFLLTMEHQVTVAGCVFLLISILLLSGLTWRRRWKKSRRSI